MTAKKEKNTRRDKNRFSGLTLLKASKVNYPANPKEAKLEFFKNIYSGRDYEITFCCPEFTSLCPVTGQPDFGKIVIRYIPDKSCIESKSLKLFLFSFRNYDTFHEEAVNLILDAIINACSPRWAEVEGEFNPRGGIAIRVKTSTDNRVKTKNKKRYERKKALSQI